MQLSGFTFHTFSFRPARALSSSCGRVAGFTLIELLVVIIILGVIAGAVVPSLGGSIQTARLSAAAREVGALMDLCYQRAVATGRVHGLVLEEDRRHWQVVAEPKPDEKDEMQEEARLEPVALPGWRGRALPEGVRVRRVDLYENDLEQGLEPEDGGARVRLLFFPDGTTEFATLDLEAEDGSVRRVRLSGLSGTVSIVTPREEDE